MKQYHECAVVKDGNKRYGYFIKDGSIAQPDMLGNWNFITADKFEALVRADKMQYFIWKDNRVQVHYTDEELAQSERLGISKESMLSTIDDYFNLDVTFKYIHVTKAFHMTAFLAVAMSTPLVANLMGTNMVMGTIFVAGQNLMDVVDIAKKYGAYVTGNFNVASISMRLDTLLQMLDEYKGRRFVICTSPLEFVYNHGSTLDTRYLNTVRDKEVLSNAINICRNITERNMR